MSWWRWTCSERGACSFTLPRPSSLWAEETFFLSDYIFFEDFSAAQPFLLQQVNNQLGHDFLSSRTIDVFFFFLSLWIYEEREELFLGAACVLSSLFCSAALVLLAHLVLWGSFSLLFPVSDWGFLYTHILRHINSFFLVLLDAFSSRFFKTNVLFLYTLFSSTYISFMFPLASVSFV